MTTRFVERRDGRIVGDYANPQSGTAEEAIDEADAEFAAYRSPPPTAADVKAEAARRIEAIMPDYKQRNVMAWGLETMMAYGTNPADWPAPLRAVNDQALAAWAAIKAIRKCSDEIEAMVPIPADFRDEGYWLA